MAYFLLIDTSSTAAAVIVGTARKVLVEEKLLSRREQAARINRMIEESLIKAGLKLNQIDVFGICAGPGSYTGLRVGMSTVKGLAFALQKPIIGFDRLELIALSHKIPSQKGVLLNARKGEYFWGLFAEDGGIIEPSTHLFEKQLSKRLQPWQAVITDCPNLEIPNERVILKKDFTPNSGKWLKLAGQKYEQKDFLDLAYAEPSYLKSVFTTTPKKKL